MAYFTFYKYIHGYIRVTYLSSISVNNDGRDGNADDVGDVFDVADATGWDNNVEGKWSSQFAWN